MKFNYISQVPFSNGDSIFPVVFTTITENSRPWHMMLVWMINVYPSWWVPYTKYYWDTAHILAVTGPCTAHYWFSYATIISAPKTSPSKNLHSKKWTDTQRTGAFCHSATKGCVLYKSARVKLPRLYTGEKPLCREHSSGRLFHPSGIIHAAQTVRKARDDTSHQLQ